jgi:hypothetical protein
MKRNLLITAIALAVLFGVSAIVLHRSKTKRIKPILHPIAATQPASQPATVRSPKPKYPTYLEIIRAENPAVAATQPLDYPLELGDSAHLILRDPTHLDNSGNLWITRPDGESTEKALAHVCESIEHVIVDRPVFVHWWLQGDPGIWNAAVVVLRSSSAPGGAGFDLITRTGRKPLAPARDYLWKTAYSFNGKFVVATHTGVSVFDIDPKIQEHFHPLPGCTAASNPPLTMLDTRGVLAWSPWENGKSGSSRISRFVDGNWTDLPVADWPARPIQLSMLLDGSVLRMAAGVPPSTAPAENLDANPPDLFPDQVHLSIGQLEPTNFDQKRLNALIQQLSEPDPDVRQSAFDELSRYGPAIAPLLEKVVDDQLPSARTRIRQLLRNKITPALGGLTVIDGRLNVARRCSDGTVLFFAPAGVQIPNEHDEPEIIQPAWLALRPDGRMEHPLSETITRDQKPEACTLNSLGDDWINNDESGPRRLVGLNFETLLTPAEKRFGEVVGVDAAHRWVFRTPVPDGETLLIDPRIADPTPRLPTWVIVTNKGIAGWDNADYPAVARPEQEGKWELQADGWKALEPTEKFFSELAPATQPATQATSRPTTAASFGNPILIAADGTRYYDGRTSLIMVKKNKEQTTWPLPGTAVGVAEPVLMQTQDGLLFLFNQPGRLLRIRPTPGQSEPFKLEATFTTDIPNADHPARVWLDPAGRIDFVTDGNVLTLTFPAGNIPKEIRQMMLDQKR